MKNIKSIFMAVGFILAFSLIPFTTSNNNFMPSKANATGNTVPIPNAGFEDGEFTGWTKGSQTGTLGSSITGSGTGVTIFSDSRTFTHGPHGEMGSPTLPDGSPNPYYAPSVTAGSWTFAPKNATYAVLLQPKNEQTFTQAIDALGLSGSQSSELTSMLSSQAISSGFGSGSPTDAAWITREVELTAGITYTMSWNYVGTDYVPFNDGSITSLVEVSTPSTPVIKVNNFTQSYAALGFTNPGTGDYSTNSYGSTGWQTSTYQVSVTGTYKLGFTVFNLDDTALSPVLMVDNEIGTTQLCDQAGTCQTFGGVPPNNDTAPTVPPTDTTEPAPVTTEPAPVITEPAPVVTEPDPVITDPVLAITEPVPVSTEPAPVTQKNENTTVNESNIRDIKTLPKTGLSNYYILLVGFGFIFFGLLLIQRKKYII